VIVVKPAMAEAIRAFDRATKDVSVFERMALAMLLAQAPEVRAAAIAALVEDRPMEARL
jgi:hypothetical protein